MHACSPCVQCILLFGKLKSSTDHTYLYNIHSGMYSVSDKFLSLIINNSVDTGIRIPSVQSETPSPYYTATRIESQSPQPLGVDHKALPVLLGMEEDDSERTVKRIRGPGSEPELPGPQSIQEATQGSYIRLGPHSPCKCIIIFPLKIHHVM